MCLRYIPLYRHDSGAQVLDCASHGSFSTEHIKQSDKWISGNQQIFAIPRPVIWVRVVDIPGDKHAHGGQLHEQHFGCTCLPVDPNVRNRKAAEKIIQVGKSAPKHSSERVHIDLCDQYACITHQAFSVILTAQRPSEAESFTNDY